MKETGLKTKLKFHINLDEEITPLEYIINPKTKTNKINIIKKKKTKDSSTNKNLLF